MIMGDVEETVTTVEIDEETYEEIYKVFLLFVYTVFSVLTVNTTVAKNMIVILACEGQSYLYLPWVMSLPTVIYKTSYDILC